MPVDRQRDFLRRLKVKGTRSGSRKQGIIPFALLSVNRARARIFKTIGRSYFIIRSRFPKKGKSGPGLCPPGDDINLVVFFESVNNQHRVNKRVMCCFSTSFFHEIFTGLCLSDTPGAPAMPLPTPLRRPPHCERTVFPQRER